MLLLDLSHTSHTPARTGIQRVARALWQHLGSAATPVTRDAFLGGWRALESWELENLRHTRGGAKRKAQWPVIPKWRGRVRRILGRTRHHVLKGEFRGFIEPEIFAPHVARELPRVFAHVDGPRVALFHDSIPLRFPELTPPRTVARFPLYLRELLQFDGIAAVSEESRDSLLGFWRWLGVSNPPPVIALPLGVDAGSSNLSGFQNQETGRRVVLCVGTLEGRKNHLALLEACEQLWARGVAFELRMIGHVNAETGGTALARLRALQAAGRPLRYDGPVADETIAEAYAGCAFTIYPSIAEGFGLPVIESLARGKPCVCSGRGALGEISRGGGCVPLEDVTAPALVAAIEHLLARPDELAALTSAARARVFKTWTDYARELTTWMRDLPRR